MPIDPAAPFALTEAGRAAERAQENARRLARLERNQGNRAITQTASAPWIYPPLSNGFTPFGAGLRAPGYYGDALGRIYLGGSAATPDLSGVAFPVPIFTLAVGYRPAYRSRHVVAAEFADSIANYIVDVATNGVVSLAFTFAGNGSELPFDGVSFRTT